MQEIKEKFPTFDETEVEVVDEEEFASNVLSHPLSIVLDM